MSSHHAAQSTPTDPTHRSVAVVTDSTPYLPQSLIDHWGIHQVSLYVGWNGKLRAEHEYRDLDAFYARLHESPQLPTTSQPALERSAPPDWTRRVRMRLRV